MFSSILGFFKGTNFLQLGLASLALFAVWTGGVQYGKLSNKLDEANKTVATIAKANETLAESAKQIIANDQERQRIEDILDGAKDDSKVRAPVILRTSDLLRKCAGKTSKCTFTDPAP